MKKKLLKTQAVVLFLFIFASQAVFAKAAKKAEAEENWPEIFATEITKIKSNLGPQCFFKSDAEYKASLKKQKAHGGAHMTDAEFMEDLKKKGFYVANYFISQTYEVQGVCHLTQSEYLAIRMYTGSFYTQINSALRKLDLAELKKYENVIKFLMSGLAKLKDYVGVTKRGTSLNPAMIATCEAGSAFADRGFMSTSVGGGFAGQYRFILASKSCKYVAPFSMYPDEEEVLCMPGTVFQIRYMNKGASGNEVILQEAGQRFDLDDLIQALEDQPDLQKPQAGEFWSLSCQPENVIFDKEAPQEH